jgi:hypothetical protein
MVVLHVVAAGNRRAPSVWPRRLYSISVGRDVPAAVLTLQPRVYTHSFVG